MKGYIFIASVMLFWSCETENSKFQSIISSFETSTENNGEFPSTSQSFYDEELKMTDSLQSKLDKINRADLSVDNKINYDVLKLIQLDKKGNLQYEMYRIPFDAEVGFHNEINYYINSLQINKTEDAARYLKKLRAYPEYIRSNILLMREGLAKGIVSNQLIACKYQDQIAPFASPDTNQNLLITSITTTPESDSKLWLIPYSDSVINVVFQEIIPAYKEYADFMETEYLPVASLNPGISEIPNGKAFYDNRIKYYTTLDVSAEDVYQIGVREVERIQNEMESILKRLDFEDGYAAFVEFLRNDPQFYSDSPEDLLEKASYFAKKIDGLLPGYFNHLPRLPYGVSPVPEAIAPQYTSGRYAPGSREANRAGQYWVNTHNLSSRPLYALPALTLHEAVPGHHLQIALADELGKLPKFRKTYISAFGEGWALYCEYLGDEMGVYETPYEQFGRLTYEMWRACRLVVDPGLHVMGWSREKALDYLASRTALSLHECNMEIDRYIGWPGQAVSYKMGELKIKELRQKAISELGDNFNLSAFHDLVLSNGSIPLSTLEEIVDNYIKQEKK